jgi:hypothetical protein
MSFVVRRINERLEALAQSGQPLLGSAGRLYDESWVGAEVVHK